MGGKDKHASRLMPFGRGGGCGDGARGRRGKETGTVWEMGLGGGFGVDRGGDTGYIDRLGWGVWRVGYVVMKKAPELMEGPYVELLAGLNGSLWGGSG